MISEEQKQIIQKILQPFAPSRIGIFGSFARGEARADSDLDILVNFTGKLSLIDLIGLEQELSSSLNCKVDLVTERSLHPRIKDYIQKDIIYLQ